MNQEAAGRVEKTVFISYRRNTGAVWALAISKELTHHGYDVFFDFQGIASGDFEQVIVQNIKARAHFLVLLTPSALERIDREGDWLRREIGTALAHRRNIIPVMLDGFDFATPSIGERLTGSIAALKSYNGLTVPVEYFEAAMQRLRDRHLNIPVDAVLHPPSAGAKEAASRQQDAAEAASPVPLTELTGEQWYERAYTATDPDDEIFLYTQAISLKPDLAPAFCNRGNAFYKKGDLEKALADYEEFIRLEPEDYRGYLNRGNLLFDRGELDRAVADYDESIRLESWNPTAFAYRGYARAKQGQHWTVVADLSRYLSMSEDTADEDLRQKVASTLDDYRANPPKDGKTLLDHVWAAVAKYSERAHADKSGARKELEQVLAAVIQHFRTEGQTQDAGRVESDGTPKPGGPTDERNSAKRKRSRAR